MLGLLLAAVYGCCYGCLLFGCWLFVVLLIVWVVDCCV